MKPTIFIALLIFRGIAAAADEPSSEPKDAKERPCIANFTEKGSFFKGKAYATWQEHEGAEYDAAFRKVAQAVAENNWGSVDANKDLGMITASQTVTMGDGSVAPLSVLVKEKAGGIIRVEARFGLAGMQTAATKTVRTALCKLVEAPAN